jgi:hypothetical protein
MVLTAPDGTDLCDSLAWVRYSTTAMPESFDA